jgi:hypothetical protein
LGNLSGWTGHARSRSLSFFGSNMVAAHRDISLARSGEYPTPRHLKELTVRTAMPLIEYCEMAKAV